MHQNAVLAVGLGWQRGKLRLRLAVLRNSELFASRDLANQIRKYCLRFFKGNCLHNTKTLTRQSPDARPVLPEQQFSISLSAPWMPLAWSVKNLVRCCRQREALPKSTINVTSFARIVRKPHNAKSEPTFGILFRAGIQALSFLHSENVILARPRYARKNPPAGVCHTPWTKRHGPGRA